MSTEILRSPDVRREGVSPLCACNLCRGSADICLPGEPALVRCRDCGLVSLREFPESAEREAGYQEEYYDGERGERFIEALERALLSLKRLRVRAILKRVPGKGSFLDVGCGRGDLLQLFGEKGWRAVGTQISRTAAEAARTRRGVEVIVGELPELDLPRSSFRAIGFFHVLEHLDRPEEYLRKARDLLADGGLLVVEVPNFQSPGFRILGLRDLCLDHPHHLVFFTPSSLEALLAKCGFAVEGASHFSLEYSPFTTLQNLLNVLPGPPNRLYRSLMRNEKGRLLRRKLSTWLMFSAACALALPAFLISLAGLLFPIGNTLRLYCRKENP